MAQTASTSSGSRQSSAAAAIAGAMFWLTHTGATENQTNTGISLASKPVAALPFYYYVSICITLFNIGAGTEFVAGAVGSGRERRTICSDDAGILMEGGGGGGALACAVQCGRGWPNRGLIPFRGSEGKNRESVQKTCLRHSAAQSYVSC